MLNEFEDQDYTEAPNGRENIVNTPPNSWNELAAQQRATRETEQMNANQQLFDGFVNIETAARDRQLALNHQRAIAGAAMIDSAFRNGGMSDRSLSQAFSEAFGQPIYGGQILDLPDGKGKAFVMYGAAKDPQTGEAKVAPVAMMDGTQMMKVLQSANLGDRTKGVQNAIYGDLSSRFTPDQLGKMGVSRPSAPISTGGAVISAAGMRALRGEPRPRSTVSVFSNIGGDGYAGTGTRSATIRPDGTRDEVTTGSRREDAPGKWRVLESSADGTRYENDKTGEVVNVPKGSNLREVLRSGGSERERIAQMNNDSRERRAQIAADATREKANKMKEVAEIRARAAGKKDGFKVGDLKILNDIANDPMADDESREAARGLMGDAIDQLSSKKRQSMKQGGGRGEKQVTGYRYNKDRSKRIPVYSDGTEGEVEDVK